MQRISKQQLARNLDAAIGDEVGIEGLNILLYGWKKARHFGPTYCQVLINRDWLYLTEALDFSSYVGYDLT